MIKDIKQEKDKRPSSAQGKTSKARKRSYTVEEIELKQQEKKKEKKLKMERRKEEEAIKKKAEEEKRVKERAEIRNRLKQEEAAIGVLMQQTQDELNREFELAKVTFEHSALEPYMLRLTELLALKDRKQREAQQELNSLEDPQQRTVKFVDLEDSMTKDPDAITEDPDNRNLAQPGASKQKKKE